MSDEFLDVEIGRVILKVPIVESPDKTRQLADRINQILLEIEQNSSRIDTRTFALLAAFRFAAEAETERLGRESDAKEIIKLLENLNGTIHDLIGKLSQEL